jgi:hypothetical protein
MFKFLVVSGMECRGIPEMTGKDGFGNSVLLHSRNNDMLVTQQKLEHRVLRITHTIFILLLIQREYLV